MNVTCNCLGDERPNDYTRLKWPMGWAFLNPTTEAVTDLAKAKASCLLEAVHCLGSMYSSTQMLRIAAGWPGLRCFMFFLPSRK